MNRPHGDPDPRSTGFTYSRRLVLKSGVTLGASLALAGCSGIGDETEGDEPTPTPSSSVSADGFVEAGLRIRESELVSHEDGYGTFLRVVVENELDETVGMVGFTVQFFEDAGDELEFLDIRQATVAGLAPGEAFEGYIRCFAEDPAAYVIQADMTRRKTDPEPLEEVTATHCLEHRAVNGTVTNEGSEGVDRLRVKATFFSETGGVLGSGTDTITRLGPGEGAPFEVDFDRVVEDRRVRVDDYAVSVGDFSNALLAVR